MTPVRVLIGGDAWIVWGWRSTPESCGSLSWTRTRHQVLNTLKGWWVKCCAFSPRKYRRRSLIKFGSSYFSCTSSSDISFKLGFRRSWKAVVALQSEPLAWKTLRTGVGRNLSSSCWNILFFSWSLPSATAGPPVEYHSVNAENVRILSSRSKYRHICSEYSFLFVALYGCFAMSIWHLSVCSDVNCGADPRSSISLRTCCISSIFGIWNSSFRLAPLRTPESAT